MKKYKIFLIIISILFVFSFVGKAKATMSVDEIMALIAQLKAQIAQLQSQLAEMRKEPTALSSCKFNLNLKLGDKGSSVAELQEALEKEGFSLGTEKTTQYFGILTRLAVVNFQERYINEILTPLGLKNGTGFFGNATRLKLKNIYCKISQESAALPSINFSYSIYSVLENEPYAIITVNLSAANTKDVSVSYETANGGTATPYSATSGTATPNADYYPTNGVLTFTPGQTSNTFKVNIIDDQIAETDETVKLRLFNFQNGKLGSPVEADLYIIDDDHSTPKVYFNPLFYSVDENSNIVLNVSLSKSTPDTVTVQYYTSDFTAKAGSDYQAADGTLTFAPGETSKNIQISIIDDSAYEGNEIFNVTLKNPDKAELPLIKKATVTIKDNEQPLPAVRFDPILYSVNENSGSVVLYVSLSASSGNTVSVSYQTSNLTATAGSDYQASNGTLTFDPGQTSKTIPIVILDDTTYEGNEMFTVTLKDPVNADLGFLKTAIVTIKDDEQPLPIVRFDPVLYNVNENSSNVILYVSLSGASNNTVTVNYLTSDFTATAGSDYQATNGTLTFDPGQTSKTIPIVIINDNAYEGNEIFNVKLESSTNATLGVFKTATVTIKDDDSSNQLLQQQQQQQQTQQY